MKKFVLAVLLAFCSIPASFANIRPEAASTAFVETPNVARWYKVYWGGVHVADLKAEIHGNQMDTVIESFGLAKKVSKYESKSRTMFDLVDGQYRPQSFYTEFQQRHGDRTIDIKYAPDGKIAQETVTPPDNRAKRPAVTDERKHSSADPLTAAIIARQKIRESLEKGQKHFSFPMYDGRRLSTLDFTIHGRMPRRIDGVDYNVVKVSFKRIPVQGYTGNELKRMKKEEPEFTVYLSDDEQLLPIKADAAAPLGTAVLILEKECASMAACG